MNVRDQGTRRPRIPRRAGPPSPGSPVPIEDRPIGLDEQRKDLAAIELGDRRRLVAAVANLVKLALGPGADQQPIVGPDEGVHERLHPQHLARDAVGVESIDGVIAGRDRLGCGGAPAGRARHRRPGLAEAARLNPDRAGRRLVVAAAATAPGPRSEPGPSRNRGHPPPWVRNSEPRAGAPAAGLGRRSRVKSTVSGPEQGPHLGLRGVEEDRRLAVGQHAVDQAFAIAARVDRAVGTDRQAEQVSRLAVVSSAHLPSADRFQSCPVGPVAAYRLPCESAARSQMYWTLGPGRDAGCLGSLRFTTLPLGPVPA